MGQLHDVDYKNNRFMKVCNNEYYRSPSLNATCPVVFTMCHIMQFCELSCYANGFFSYVYIGLITTKL